MWPFLRMQFFRIGLLQHGYFVGPQLLPENLSLCGFLTTGPASNLFHHRLSVDSHHPLGPYTCSSLRGLPQAAGWISAPQWTSMGYRGTPCLTVVFTMGCRGNLCSGTWCLVFSFSPFLLHCPWSLHSCLFRSSLLVAVA